MTEKEVLTEERDLFARYDHLLDEFAKLISKVSRRIRFDHRDRLNLGGRNLPSEHLSVTGHDPKSGEEVVFDVVRAWGNGGCQWCGCALLSSGGNGSCYRVLKGDRVIASYDRLSEARESPYLEAFRLLFKIAELKHRERRWLKHGRLTLLRSLKKNERVLWKGRTGRETFEEAWKGDVEAMLTLARGYETGVASAGLSKSLREAFGWYLRAALCWNRPAMVRVCEMVREGLVEVDEATFADYWRKSCREDKVRD